MRIGIIGCWYRDTAGTQDNINFKESYEKLGHEVRIISTECACKDRYDKNMIHGDCDWVALPYVEYATGSWFFDKMAFLAQKFFDLGRGAMFLFKGRDCNLLHYQQEAGSFGVTPLITFLGIPSSRKRVITVHFIDRVQNKFPFVNRVYKRADVITVHSVTLKEKLRSLTGLPEDRIKVIPFGTSIPELKDLERKEITFFGTPDERKGILTVIEALKILKEQNRETKVHIYGNYTAEERERTVEFARMLGVEECLAWGGFLREERVFDKFQESLFTLSVYEKGEGSSVIVHALATATPVIATDVGGLPEYVGEGGVIIPPGDAKALAEAMIELMDSPELRKRCGEEGRKRALEVFDREIVAKKIIDLLYSSS